MARSLRSKRRKKNKQLMRTKLKPKYDAQLASIVKNLHQETDQVMETTENINMSDNVQILDENGQFLQMDTGDNIATTEGKSKIKIPKVNIEKMVKFMSQRKLRTFKAKQKAKKKQQKIGQKKKKDFKW